MDTFRLSRVMKRCFQVRLQKSSSLPWVCSTGLWPFSFAAVRAGRQSANRFPSQRCASSGTLPFLSPSSSLLFSPLLCPDIIHADGNKLVLSMETASQHKWQIESQASELLLIKLFLEQSALPSRVCAFHSNQKFLANQSVLRLVMPFGVMQNWVLED